jgi:hypothetical protein
MDVALVADLARLDGQCRLVGACHVKTEDLIKRRTYKVTGPVNRRFPGTWLRQPHTETVSR